MLGNRACEVQIPCNLGIISVLEDCTLEHNLSLTNNVYGVGDAVSSMRGQVAQQHYRASLGCTCVSAAPHIDPRRLISRRSSHKIIVGLGHE